MRIRYPALLLTMAMWLPGPVAADYGAVLYDPAHVLEVDIQMDADLWDRLCAQKRTFVSLFQGACFAQPFASPFTWFAARVSIDGQVRENVGVRKKGFLGSLDAVKPGLKIKLDEFQPNDAIDGVKRMTLNNAKQDPSLVRQCLGYQLFAQAGVPSPRCNFARVKVNGRELGIYVNVEDVRKPMLGRHFAKAGGNLYEGTVSDFHPVLVDTFEAQTNEEAKDRSDLQLVIAALGASDADLPAALGAIVDLDAFMTFWATEALVGAWDGYAGNRNNFYLYRDPSTGRFHFIPWGIDTILSEGYPVAALNPAANKAVFAYSAITRRLVDLPQMRARYLATMQTLLGSVWNETAILAEIDRMEALLAPHAGDLTASTASVRSFVNSQRALLAQELVNGFPEFPPLTIVDFCLVRNGAVRGNFVATWGSAGTAAPFTSGASALQGSVGGGALASAAGWADVGPDVANPNAHEGLLSLYLELSNGKRAVLAATLDPTQVAPGASLAIDGQAVDATLVYLDGVTPSAYLDQGKLKLNFASTKPGGKVCGSLEANTYFFSFALLAGGTPAQSVASGPGQSGSLGKPDAGIQNTGSVMRDCQPGKGAH